MAINLGTLTQTAMRAAGRAGLTGSLTLARAAGTTIDPLTGATSGAGLAQAVPRAVELTPRQLRGRTAAWLEARAAVMVAASDLTWTPTVHDTAMWAGRTGKITAVTILAPAGEAIAYELAIGA